MSWQGYARYRNKAHNFSQLAPLMAPFFVDVAQLAPRIAILLAPLAPIIGANYWRQLAIFRFVAAPFFQPGKYGRGAIGAILLAPIKWRYVALCSAT